MRWRRSLFTVEITGAGNPIYSRLCHALIQRMSLYSVGRDGFKPVNILVYTRRGRYVDDGITIPLYKLYMGLVEVFCQVAGYTCRVL
jgi:hypothetical protein